MSMGLCNAPSAFQSIINAICYDYLQNYVVVYVEYFLISSNNERNHIKSIYLVPSRLQKHQLYGDTESAISWRTQ